MKKNLIKVLSVLLTAGMVLGTAVPAIALEEPDALILEQQADSEAEEAAADEEEVLAEAAEAGDKKETDPEEKPENGDETEAESTEKKEVEDAKEAEAAEKKETEDAKEAEAAEKTEAGDAKEAEPAGTAAAETKETEPSEKTDAEEPQTQKAGKIAYSGEDVKIVKENLTDTFGMLSPQEGSTWVLSGDKVKIHIIPSNRTVYGGWHWGSIEDELTMDFAINDDGTIDLELDKSYCGYAHPIAPIKRKDGKTTSAQYYLAIPSEDKLEEEVIAAEAFAYDGDAVSFIKEDGSGFGMWTAQEGTAAVLSGDTVKITYYPKNKTVYKGFYYGDIAIESTWADFVSVDADGNLEFTVSKDHCGYAWPVAPIKKKDGATTGDQYYLAIPAEDKLEEEVIAAEAFAYDGDAVSFIKEDGSGFGMWTAQEGTAAVLSGDTVKITYYPKNKTVYKGFYYGDIAIESTWADFVSVDADGNLEFTVSKDHCGYAHPVAPIKKKDGATTGDQYYLAIPAEDKLEKEEEPTPTPEPTVEPTPTPEPTVEPTPTPAPTKDILVADDGDYSNVKTSTTGKMFRVVKAVLHAKDDNMTATVTLSGTGYIKLYPGTAEEAAANPAGAISFSGKSSEADSGYYFEVPVSQLDKDLPFAAFSEKNQLWYDRTIRFSSEGIPTHVKKVEDDGKPEPTPIPTPAADNENQQANTNGSTAAVDSSTTLKDGEYTPDAFSFSGGTGKVQITCTRITVTGGKAFATLVFDSSKYGYVKAGGSTYYPVVGAGTTTFTIPVELNKNNRIIGMTTAMSQPHEIEYVIYVYLAAAEGKTASGDGMQVGEANRLDEKAPEIVGLKAVEEVKMDYADYLKIFRYEDDITLVEIDLTKDSVLDPEYLKKQEESKPEKTESEEAASEDAEPEETEARSTQKTVEDYVAELYRNDVVKYLVVPEKAEIPAGLEKQVIVIRQPAEELYASSKEAVQALEDLELLSALKALGMEEEEIENRTLKKALKDEKLILAGSFDKPEYRSLVKEEIDLAFGTEALLPLNEEAKKEREDAEETEQSDEMTAEEYRERLYDVTDHFAAFSIPMLLDRSSAEKDKKGAAEWIRLYGVLFDREEEAEKLLTQTLKELENEA